jgi:hypothetical protein
MNERQIALAITTAKFILHKMAFENPAVVGIDPRILADAVLRGVEAGMLMAEFEDTDDTTTTVH